MLIVWQEFPVGKWTKMNPEVIRSSLKNAPNAKDCQSKHHLQSSPLARGGHWLFWLGQPTAAPGRAVREAFWRVPGNENHHSASSGAGGILGDSRSARPPSDWNSRPETRRAPSQRLRILQDTYMFIQIGRIDGLSEGDRVVGIAHFRDTTGRRSQRLVPGLKGELPVSQKRGFSSHSRNPEGEI